MSAIQISFEGKQQTIDQQVPQPSSAKKGVPISLPPSCDIDYQQRLLRVSLTLPYLHSPTPLTH